MAMFSRHEQSLLAGTLPLPASPYKGEEFEIGSSLVNQINKTDQIKQMNQRDQKI